MTDPCITCGRECNNLPCQHCADRSKPRTVGFLDIPPPATPFRTFLLTLHPDGRVELGGGITPCECARALIESLQSQWAAAVKATPNLWQALALPEVQALVEALREISDMRPHHAGQTRNECLMQQIAGDALRKVEWK